MAVVWKKLAFETDVITKALLVAKGDMIYASAAATPAALTIGTANYVLRVATDVPAWVDFAHAATHKNGAADELLLHELGEPTAAIEISGQQLQNAVLHNSADNPAVAVDGKIYFKTGDTSVYVCTSDT